MRKSPKRFEQETSSSDETEPEYDDSSDTPSVIMTVMNFMRGQQVGVVSVRNDLEGRNDMRQLAVTMTYAADGSSSMHRPGHKG